MLKKLSIVVITILIFLSIAIFVYVQIQRKNNIQRGNELKTNLLTYQQKFGKLPKNNDWALLKSIGFTSEELDRAYPSYCRIDNSRFQLIFVVGFDSPYLTWDSKDDEWEMRGLSCVNQQGY